MHRETILILSMQRYLLLAYNECFKVHTLRIGYWDKLFLWGIRCAALFNLDLLQIWTFTLYMKDY